MSELALHFHPLTFHDEGDSVTVGRTDQEMFVSLPPDGAALLTELVDGLPPHEAARWYRDRYHEEVDLQGFISALSELGFLAEAEDVQRSGPRPRFSRLGAAVYSPPAAVGYALVVLAAVLVMVRQPALAPTPHHLVFGPYVSLNFALLIVGQLPFILLHEAAHALAGRRLGLRSRTTLSHRFLDLVLETNLDGLVAVPRRRRILPILAGIGADLVVYSVLTLCAAAAGSAGHTRLTEVCLALGFATLTRIVWQLYFCMRTDIYYLVCLLARTQDLHGASRWLIGRWVARLTRSRRESRLARAAWAPQDLWHARWYAPLMVVGYLTLVTNLVLVLGPVTVRLWRGAVTAVWSGTSGGIAPLIDSGAFFAMNLAQLGLVLMIRHRTRRDAS